MSNKVYTPFPPSVQGSLPKSITASETELQLKVFKHFAATDYTLPGVEKGELMEEEKFWLVWRFYPSSLLCAESIR